MQARRHSPCSCSEFPSQLIPLFLEAIQFLTKLLDLIFDLRGRLVGNIPRSESQVYKTMEICSATRVYEKVPCCLFLFFERFGVLHSLFLKLGVDPKGRSQAKRDGVELA